MTKSLSEWREQIEATEEIELSIGTTVIKTRVTLMDLAAAGHIPATLLIDIDEIGKKAKADPRKAGAEGVGQLAQAVNALAVAAFIEPPLAHAADDAHLGVNEIPFADRMIVFTRLNQGVEAVRAFREEQGQPNGTPHPGDDVSPAAVGDIED